MKIKQESSFFEKHDLDEAGIMPRKAGTSQQSQHEFEILGGALGRVKYFRCEILARQGLQSLVVKEDFQVRF